MKPLLLYVAMVVSLSSTADDPRQRHFERLRQREELHQKMFQALRGHDLESSMLEMEKMMNEMMSDLHSDMQGFSAFSAPSFQAPFRYDWRMNDVGRSLVITPSSKETKLDVKVENQLLTIQSIMKNGEAKKIMSVPPDCDADKVKMEEKDGNLVLFFPFKSKDSDLKPLPGAKDDVQT
jgi:hypothetical protein